MTMRGQLRTGPKVLPFRLVLEGPVIRYEFTEPPQTLVLRLGDKSSRLEEVAGGDTNRITPARYDDKVRGTDLSYEDLSLRFLYWPQARVEGEQSLQFQKCWKVRASPGKGDSQYGSVLLWVGQESGALLQAEAFAESGVFMRRFKVISGQKIEGKWMLKQMRIEAAPAPGKKDAMPTYLEVKGEER